MKIDQEKYPALFDDNLIIGLYDNLIDDSTRSIFKDMLQLAKSNLTYLSTTIMTPMLESYTKLVPHRGELKDSTRGLLFHSKAGNPHLFLYSMFTDNDKIQIICQISCNAKGGQHFGQLFAGYVDRDKTDKVYFRSYKTIPPLGTVELHDQIVSDTLMAILSAELFINYAEVETKELQPNRQIWEGPRAIYNNKTKFPINVIDSTWYTNLVSSGAFKVRGHFRLQPYGQGMAKRRLQWIADFEKEGYTRKAKISSQPETQ